MLSKSYQTSYRKVCQIRNIHNMCEVKNISQTWVDQFEMPELIATAWQKNSQLKKPILKFRQNYHAKHKVGPNKMS